MKNLNFIFANTAAGDNNVSLTNATVSFEQLAPGVITRHLILCENSWDCVSSNLINVHCIHTGPNQQDMDVKAIN